jgi:hypothetical protein
LFVLIFPSYYNVSKTRYSIRLFILSFQVSRETIMSHSSRFVLALGAMLFTGIAFAHTPLCSCYDNGDGTVLCEGGFSDGSSASGVKMRVVDGSGNTVLEGAMSEDSEFEFNKPKGEYMVIFDAGPGHEVEIDGNDIVE